MLFKNSRYADSPRFEPDAGGGMPFRGLRPRDVPTATPVIEHEIVAGDRLDHLARHYYNDDRLWWRLIDASPEFLFAPDALAADNAGQALPVPGRRE